MTAGRIPDSGDAATTSHRLVVIIMIITDITILQYYIMYCDVYNSRMNGINSFIPRCLYTYRETGQVNGGSGECFLDAAIGFLNYINNKSFHDACMFVFNTNV